ncbi:MAG: RNA polymerase sigma factor [Deltaproteobacteria bacterium]|nr:RNA polymerase sigma factor [Deltaproteobacteria bacterium]
MTSQLREARLVLRAQSGDLEALDTLLEGIQAPLFRYLRNLVGEEALAEDLLQEVFLLVCRKIKWLREPRVFRAWAYRIASREAKRSLGREKRWRDQVRDEAVLSQLSDPKADFAEEVEMAAHLPELVSAVPAASRAVLLLHYQEELTLREISDVLELPLGTIKSRLAYGLATLRSGINSETP